MPTREIDTVTDRQGRLLAATGELSNVVDANGRLVSSASNLQDDSISGTGFNAPTGTLTNLRTAIRRQTLERAELVILVDSTGYGSTPSSSEIHPWQNRVRKRMVEDFDWIDGGLGIVNIGLNLDADYYDPLDGDVNPVLADTLSGSNAYSLGILKQSTPHSDTVNEHRTFQGKGTKARIWRVNRGILSGGISYSIDGDTPIEWDADSTEAHSLVMVELGTDTEESHTIDIVNLGGSPATPPVLTLAAGGQQGAGNVPLGAYYYVATQLRGGGESLPSESMGPFVITGPGAQTVDVRLNGTGWDGDFNLYRGTDPDGPFGLVGGATGIAGFLNFPILVDNTAVPGIAPPVVNTAGRGGSAECQFAVEFLKDRGVVFHNHGIPSISANSYLDGTDYPAATDNDTNDSIRPTLGFSRTDPTNPIYNGDVDSDINARNICAVLCELGINDEQQGVSKANYKKSLLRLVRFCEPIEADLILIIPHFEAANLSENQQTYRDAINEVISEENIAWIDFGVSALGPFDTWGASGYGGTGSNPHLTALGYDTQADFLVDSLLSQL